MPKEYVITITVNDEQLKDIARTVRSPENPDTEEFGTERQSMPKMEAREQVLMAVVYGIQKEVKKAAFRVFIGNGSIAITEIKRGGAKRVVQFLALRESCLDAEFKKMTKKKAKKKTEKKTEKGKEPDWWADALFNRGKTEPSEIAAWIYKNFFEREKKKKD